MFHKKKIGVSVFYSYYLKINNLNKLMNYGKKILIRF